VSQTSAVSGKQLVRILEGQGWYVKRVRGSHHIMRHPSQQASIQWVSGSGRGSAIV
jgi:predicted RNA binding protein YcfA (HicA-like mRNA interferase family)